jgi:hypothetical protein
MQDGKSWPNITKDFACFGCAEIIMGKTKGKYLSFHHGSIKWKVQYSNFGWWLKIKPGVGQ